jgi:pullulanase
VESAAQSREVAVTFRVTVPGQTPPDGTIFVAGDFQGWNPGKTTMTRAGDSTWEISVPFTEGAAPQYKYTRGTWEAVEKDDGCGEIPNRTFTVTFGDTGSQPVADTVEKWRDVDQCG